MTHRLLPVLGMLALVFASSHPAIVLADAGAVRVSERHGSRQITVFSDPTTVRVGTVDLSVLVQDAGTGEALFEDEIELQASHRDDPQRVVRAFATSAIASNKLFKAAHVELTQAGLWDVSVALRGARGDARLSFEIEVGEPLPPWQALWPWFCWPVLPIGLFAILRLRLRRQGPIAGEKPSPATLTSASGFAVPQS